MQTIFKPRHLIVVGESDAECAALSAWRESCAEAVFEVVAQPGSGLTLRSLGTRADVCREPINVTSMSRDPQIKLIANFAATPFVLEEETYSSVESFWQSLKFTDETERRRIAAMTGQEAKRAGSAVEYGATVTYRGEAIPVGAWSHWQLMHRACWAKFTQCAAAGAALRATGRRPLAHRVRRDSRTIPGVIMADIWMRIRERLTA